MKYKTVVCGGTFDLLHKGHKSFINQILRQSDKIIIGLTSDSYTRKFKNEIWEDHKKRLKNLRNFLTSAKVQNRVKIISIDDIYGPLLDKDLKADALAVTPQTNRTAIGINQERKDMDLPPIEILVIKMDLAGDGGLITSTRIRKGEINREGRPYIDPEWEEKTLFLPSSLRPLLQKPFGRILSTLPSNLDSEKTITIGDITTQKLNSKKIAQILSIVDFAVRRHKRFDKLSELGFLGEIGTLTVQNPPGEITWELFEAIKKSLETSQRKVILVNGEEDLAVLPAILVAPLGFKIYYGQPDEGLVEVEVTEETKEKSYDLIRRFKLS